MHACEVVDADKRLLAAVDYYFIQEDGKRFKVFVPFLPYFYVKCKSDEVIQETSAFLSKKFGGLIRGNVKTFFYNFFTIMLFCSFHGLRTHDDLISNSLQLKTISQSCEMCEILSFFQKRWLCKEAKSRSKDTQ